MGRRDQTITISLFTRRRRRWMSCSPEVRLFRFSRFCGSGRLRRRSIMCARSVMRSISALHSREFRNQLSPFRERQVAGHDYCRLLGPSHDHLEQELRADFRQRHITGIRPRPYRNRLGGRGQSRALQAQQHRPERISHFVRGQRDAATVSSEYIFEMELQQALERALLMLP